MPAPSLFLSPDQFKQFIKIADLFLTRMILISESLDNINDRLGEIAVEIEHT